MVVFDGIVYQVRSNGKVYQPESSQETPFATVCQFEAEKVLSLKPGLDYEGLKKQLDKIAPNQNLFYAIKITGKFKTMKTRSVPEQHKPYPPLKEVTKHQPEFNMENISGTIVGFRCPPYVKGINVPGYHLHFISDDKTRGGHILKFEILSGECEIDILNQYFLALPVDDKEFAETNLSINRSKELDEVEK
jgi:acetolactate decarboxylase